MQSTPLGIDVLGLAITLITLASSSEKIDDIEPHVNEVLKEVFSSPVGAVGVIGALTSIAAASLTLLSNSVDESMTSEEMLQSIALNLATNKLFQEDELDD